LIRLPLGKNCLDRALSLDAPMDLSLPIASACRISQDARFRRFAPRAVFVARPSKVLRSGGWYVVEVYKSHDAIPTQEVFLSVDPASLDTLPSSLTHGNVHVRLVSPPDRAAIRMAFRNLR
jgi:hypothetical protein